MRLRALVPVLFATAAGLAQAQFGLNIDAASVSVGGSHGALRMNSDGSGSASVHGSGGSASMHSSGAMGVSGRQGAVAVDGRGASSAAVYGRSGSMSMSDSGGGRVVTRRGDSVRVGRPVPASPSEDWCARRRAQGVIC